MIVGYTLNATHQLHLDEELRSLEAGKRADLIIVTKNLFVLNAPDIHQARIDLTDRSNDDVRKSRLRERAPITAGRVGAGAVRAAPPSVPTISRGTET